jgi:hypothetical protein
MRISRLIPLGILMVGILLTSCGGQAATEPAPDVDAILTAGVGTLAASIFQTQTALVPPVTDTITPSPVPTSTPIPLLSPLPSPTTQIILLNTAIVWTVSPTPTGTRYTPTVNPSTLAFGCNNLRLLRDETIPSGTVFKPGEKFTKTWKVENNGTCDWVYLYRLVFLSGNNMDGNPPGLGKVIPPGKWTQLSISLTAPTKSGSYNGYWRFGDQSGNMFGSTLSVSIEVSAPTKTPKPTQTNTTAPPTFAPTETPSPTPSETPTTPAVP